MQRAQGVASCDRWPLNQREWPPLASRQPRLSAPNWLALPIGLSHHGAPVIGANLTARSGCALTGTTQPVTLVPLRPFALLRVQRPDLRRGQGVVEERHRRAGRPPTRQRLAGRSSRSVTRNSGTTSAYEALNRPQVLPALPPGTGPDTRQRTPILWYQKVAAQTLPHRGAPSTGGKRRAISHLQRAAASNGEAKLHCFCGSSLDRARPLQVQSHYATNAKGSSRKSGIREDTRQSAPSALSATPSAAECRPELSRASRQYYADQRYERPECDAEQGCDQVPVHSTIFVHGPRAVL
jgi:hypothetical protein